MPRRILLTLACLLMAAPLLSSPAAAEMPVRGMTLANTHRWGDGVCLGFLPAAAR